MRYAIIVPQYAIDRLLITNLDVNFQMNANKMWCKYRFFLFLMLVLLDEDTNAIFIYDANVPCRDENAKFIHDDASACIQTMMQMSPHRDGDANVF